MRGIPPITPGKNPYIRPPPAKLREPWPDSGDPVSEAVLRANGIEHLILGTVMAMFALGLLVWLS